MNERLGLPSGSGIERIAFCPGSRAMEEGLPDRPSSISERGDRIHAALSGDPNKVDGLKPDERDIAGRMLEERDKLSRDYLGGTPDRVWIEWRFVIFRGDGEPLASAKPDYVAIKGTKAIIIDYKTGFKETAPGPENLQLRTQAIGVYQESKPELLKAVVMRCPSERFLTKSEAIYTDADIHQSVQELVGVVWRSQQPGAPRVPGQWCDYCKAQAICPERASWALIPTVQRLSIVEKLSNEDLAYAHSKAGAAKKFFEEVATRLKELPPEELAKLGLELKPGVPKRKVTNIDGLYDELVRDGLITPAQFMECCEVTIGSLEVYVPPAIAERDDVTKKAAKLRFDELLEPFVKRNPVGPSIKEMK